MSSAKLGADRLPSIHLQAHRERGEQLWDQRSADSEMGRRRKYAPLLPFGNVIWSDAAWWAAITAPRTTVSAFMRLNIFDEDEAMKWMMRTLGI